MTSNKGCVYTAAFLPRTAQLGAYPLFGCLLAQKLQKLNNLEMTRSLPDLTENLTEIAKLCSSYSRYRQSDNTANTCHSMIMANSQENMLKRSKWKGW